MAEGWHHPLFPGGFLENSLVKSRANYASRDVEMVR
jgi:hypothetical protein